VTIENIQTREQLIAFQQRYRMRESWHEPDEQGIDAVLAPGSFDNASAAPATEFEVVVERGTLGYEPGNRFDFTASVRPLTWRECGLEDRVTDPDAACAHEASVFLLHMGEPVAAVNVALLLAMACGFEGFS
jgi:hypothetical protein